jgi:hypothetical protein
MILVENLRPIVSIAAAALVAAALIYGGFRLWGVGGVVGVIGGIVGLGILFSLPRWRLRNLVVSIRFRYLREWRLKLHFWIRRRGLWAAAGIVVTLALLISLYGGYRYEWTWTGIVKGGSFSKRTLWDWLQLLFIPAVLAGGGLWFNAQQKERERRIENERAQDEALQAYLDQMSILLTDKERPLHEARLNDSLSTAARARTLTVLDRLDGQRKRHVVRFLYESGLITKDRVVLDLKEARLHKASLSYINLMKANLRRVNLNGADLMNAKLSEADLGNAVLFGAFLGEANLVGANLSGARLLDAGWKSAIPMPTRTIRQETVRVIGDSGRKNTLRGADLRRADLTDALVTEENLLSAKSLEGATMPNGQKYEDWLKSKGRGEDGENSSPP